MMSLPCEILCLKDYKQSEEVWNTCSKFSVGLRFRLQSFSLRSLQVLGMTDYQSQIYR